MKDCGIPNAKGKILAPPGINPAASVRLLFLALSSIHVQTNTATQTNSEGQCLPNGQGFDEQQEAFTLAQMAEQYRSAHPYGGNYGFASYTICYKDGTQQRYPSPPAPGYGQTSNDNHSEQALYKWLEMRLASLSIDTSQVAAIYAMIFSQVRVCPPCQRDMVTWQKGLREAARTDNLFLLVWDIKFLSKSGFDPAVSRAGNGTPVAIGDLEKVEIAFAP